MYKDRMPEAQPRRINGRWTSQALMKKIEWLLEALTERKPVSVSVVGLTKVNSMYTGLCKARRKLVEERYGDQAVPPGFVIEVLDAKGEKINSNVWQAWYRDALMREQHEKTPFAITVTSVKSLLDVELFVHEADGSKRPLLEKQAQPVVPGLGAEYVAHPGFAEQYTDDEEYELLRGKIIRLITRQEKEKMYALMRAEPERFEPFHARLAAEGLDYKETLADYEARQGHEEPPPPPMAQPAAVERVVGPPPKVQGTMTLQELRRLIDGYGEIPLAGEEDSDADWKRFEARFLELNGAEAKSPLRAALKIMQRERAALATSD